MNDLRFCLILLAAALFAGCSEDETAPAGASLPAPSNVAVADKTDVSLSFVWDAVSGADAYRCTLYDAEDRVLKVHMVSETEIRYTDLQPDTEYAFCVAAGVESVWSESVSSKLFVTTYVTGWDFKAQLAAPTVTYTAATTSLAFAWEAVDHAGGYSYKLLRAVDNVSQAEGTVTAPGVTIPDLLPGVKYLFYVKSLAEEDQINYYDSDYCAAVEAWTKVDASAVVQFPAEEMDGKLRAFPGAEGAGMYTTGGRGGRIIHVTNLNDSGEGSLRAALKESGARTIVFDVAGVIELQSTLKIENGNVTIAGQTAPGYGICLKNQSVTVSADNVIIRFMHFRPGDSVPDDGLDAIWGRYHSNIILDHCSMSWSTDECASFYANRNFTMQWCLLGQSLRNTKHSKGSHGYGGIWGGAPASFHHNVLAHHDSRNPRFDSPNTYGPYSTDNAGMSVDDRRIDYRNNVVYNFCNYGAYGGEGQRINFVGNVYKWGLASINGAGVSYKDGVMSDNKVVRRKYFFYGDCVYSGIDLGYATLYYGDNSNLFDTSVLPSGDKDTGTGENITANNKTGFAANSSSKGSGNAELQYASVPFAIMYGSNVCYVTTHPATSLMSLVKYAGASKKQDRVDAGILSDVVNGTGTQNSGSNGSRYGIIDSQDDVDGWPDYSASSEEIARQTADADGDGIPDYYEELFGLDKNDASDATAKTIDPQGLYTNFECYLHYLVQEIVLGQVAGGVYTSLQ